jgi:hypothetical protein
LREVVLSRRRVWVLLMVLVVGVMALGIVGVLRAVSASPGNKDHNPDSEGRSTLTVLTTETREARVVDLGPKGPTHGDMRVVNGPIYNESGKKKVGRIDLFCVLTDPADEPNEKVHMTQCTLNHALPGGEISAQGVIAFPKLPELPAGRDVNAITGGTGKYAGVQGEVHIKPRGEKVFITFHFID